MIDNDYEESVSLLPTCAEYETQAETEEINLNLKKQDILFSSGESPVLPDISNSSSTVDTLEADSNTSTLTNVSKSTPDLSPSLIKSAENADYFYNEHQDVCSEFNFRESDFDIDIDEVIGSNILSNGEKETSETESSTSSQSLISSIDNCKYGLNTSTAKTQPTYNFRYEISSVFSRHKNGENFSSKHKGFHKQVTQMQSSKKQYSPLETKGTARFVRGQKLIEKKSHKLYSEKLLNQEIELLGKIQDKLTKVETIVQKFFPPSIKILNRSSKILLCLDSALKKLNNCHRIKPSSLFHQEQAFLTKMSILHCITGFHRRLSNEVSQLKLMLQEDASLSAKAIKKLSKLNSKPPTNNRVIISQLKNYCYPSVSNNPVPLNTVSENSTSLAKRKIKKQQQNICTFRLRSQKLDDSIDTSVKSMVMNSHNTDHSILHINTLSEKLNQQLDSQVFQESSMEIGSDHLLTCNMESDTVEMRTETSLTPSGSVQQIKHPMSDSETLVDVQPSNETFDLHYRSGKENHNCGSDHKHILAQADFTETGDRAMLSQEKQVQFQCGRPKLNKRIQTSALHNSTNSRKSILKKRKLPGPKKIADSPSKFEKKCYLNDSVEPMDTQFTHCSNLLSNSNSSIISQSAFLAKLSSKSCQNVATQYRPEDCSLDATQFSSCGTLSAAYLSQSDQELCQTKEMSFSSHNKHFSNDNSLSQSAGEFSCYATSSPPRKKIHKSTLKLGSNGFYAHSTGGTLEKSNAKFTGQLTKDIPMSSAAEVANISVSSLPSSKARMQGKSNSSKRTIRKASKIKTGKVQGMSEFSDTVINMKDGEPTSEIVTLDSSLLSQSITNSTQTQFCTSMSMSQKSVGSNSCVSSTCVSTSEASVDRNQTAFLDNVNLRSNFDGIARINVSSNSLPGLSELIKLGIIAPSVNVLSVETPDGGVSASLVRNGLIFDSSYKIYDSINAWCASIPFLRDQGIHVSLKDCYENVMYKGQKLISFCKFNTAQLQVMQSSTIQDEELVVKTDNFDKSFDTQRIRNSPLKLNLADMKVLPITDSEIGPESLDFSTMFAHPN